MEKLVVASKSEDLVREIEGELGTDFQVFTVNSRKDLDQISLKGYALLILDQDFTETRGIDVLMSAAHMQWCPILVLTTLDDPQFASEALRAGATNYLIKSSDFRRFLKVSVAEGMQRFREREDAKSKLKELQTRISEMEVALGIDKESLEKKEKVTKTEKKRELLTEIGSLLRSGKFVLPAYPRVNELFKEQMEQGASIRDMAIELEQDIGVATRLISVANSARYRGASEVKNVEQAVGRIGLRDTAMFVEMASSRNLFANKDSKFKSMMHDLWNHSLAVGLIARETADQLDLGDPSQYFSMGLFHDIGKVVLVQILSEIEGKEALIGSVTKAETDQLLKTQHGQFGSHMLEKWNFNEKYRQVAGFHESLEEAVNPCTELLVVNFANHLANASGFSQGDPPLVNVKNLPHLKTLGITTEHVDGIKKTVMKLMEERSFS